MEHSFKGSSNQKIAFSQFNRLLFNVERNEILVKATEKGKEVEEKQNNRSNTFWLKVNDIHLEKRFLSTHAFRGRNSPFFRSLIGGLYQREIVILKSKSEEDKTNLQA